MTNIQEITDHWTKRFNNDGFHLIYAQTENKWLKLIGAKIQNMSIDEFKKIMKKAKSNITPEMIISPIKVDITKYFNYEPVDELLEKPEGFDGIKREEMFTLL